MKKDRDKRSEGRRSLDAQLLAYCAVAAGGALAAAPGAEAAVVYSGLKNLAVGDNATVGVDLDGNGVVDFTVRPITPVNLTDGNDYSKLKAQFVLPEGENAIASSGGIALGTGAQLPGEGVSWLTASSAENANGFNLEYGNVINDSAGLNILAQGPFAGRKGLLGVKFQRNNDTHYGWIRYQGMGGDANAVSGTIVDWAYEDTPFTAISADAGCSLSMIPSRISKVVHLVNPIAGIVIRGEENAYFTRESTLDWGTDSVKTLLKIRISPKLMVALVRVKPLLMEAGDTYKVTVDECAGSLKVLPQ